MIIVSQDEDNIVNFDNVVSIGIEDINNFNPWQRITAETIGTEVVLGDYATEERAKEVLMEIGERTENWKNLEQGMPSGVCRYKYKMPKE